ncbi:conserved hypothetical protein [anaerobic digester metagenome]|uniref:Uncharacterized protein n=1 Tax=anaerobic digester metagenome TaxID=1263854 RepID=A0A485M525_9ZZZZ
MLCSGIDKTSERQVFMRVFLTGFALVLSVIAGILVLVHLSCMGYLNRS